MVSHYLIHLHQLELFSVQLDTNSSPRASHYLLCLVFVSNCIFVISLTTIYLMKLLMSIQPAQDK